MKITRISETLFTFSLGITNITLQIKCNHKHLSETLGKRYSTFPPGEGVSFTAQIDWIGKERNSSLLDTNTNFQDSILHFSAPGYRGFIDEKTGQGYLQLSSIQPVEDIDYFLRVVLALLVHQVGGVMMHTAGIVRKDQAYLFFGHSGSGKTTVCRTTMEGSSNDDFKILNDDLIILLPHSNRWLAYSTPFWNPTQMIPDNQSAPVDGIYLLMQDNHVYTQQLTPGKATAAVIANIPVIPQDPVRSVQLLEILTSLQRRIPVYELHFLPDNSFWNVIPG